MYTTSIMLACPRSDGFFVPSCVGYVCSARVRGDVWKGMALAHGPHVIVRVGPRLVAFSWKHVEESCYHILVDWAISNVSTHDPKP